MPVLKKEIELEDGRKIWVRQASGMQKLKIETIQAKVFRKFRHFGANPAEWTEEQNIEFSDALDEAGGGMEMQIQTWIPNCIMEEDFDIDTLTTSELIEILSFVRGDDPEGALPLVTSSE
jgi:hypothetical protein